jgi:spoIIIJ-associated protein
MSETQPQADTTEEADLPIETTGSADAGDAPSGPSSEQGAEGAEGAEGGNKRLSAAERLEREGDIAADYLEGLLDIADLDGDIDMDVDGDRAAVSVVGGNLNHLVGRDGAVLEALQELTRLAVLAQTGERSRLMLDIGSYRARRRDELTEIARSAAERATAEKQPVRLDPMTPFERKVVHDAVAAAGLRSESEGVEPQRFVVVLPA